jgi:tetratricopeptide (TPR) repeat protein
MRQHLLSGITLFLGLGVSAVSAEPDDFSALANPWFEIRTPHLNVYGCGATEEVIKVTTQLEEFRQAYAQLAGAAAISSPPIIVFVFPDVPAMKPFLPLYDGKPLNVNGLFHHGKDENLIILGLSANNAQTAQIIFHEYTHLLLRRNDNVWPLWLKEGMAEVYSNFRISGRGVAIGGPIERHVGRLSNETLMPLHDLFAVGNDSPEYNEREHQGIFYAESWLLTEYLMLGDNPSLKSRFGQLTVLLRQGQSPEQAFTNAFRMTLPAMEENLREYLERGKFDTLGFVLNNFVSGSTTPAPRSISPVEICYHLGDELLHMDRLDAAEPWFQRGATLAPASPLSYAGLGLLESARDRPAEAVRQFAEATKRGPMSFLAHYVNAESQLQIAANSKESFSHLDPAVASSISGELQKSIALMPDFGHAHYLLGCVEMVQGDDAAGAEKHLQRAIQLEPENKLYPRTLAEIQTAVKR